MATTDQKALLAHLDRFEEEGESRKDDTPLRDAEINSRFLRGDQWPTSSGPVSPYRSPGAQYRFTLNVLNTTLMRKIALLTDTRPQMEVVPYSRLNRKAAADMLRIACLGLWDEGSLDQSFMRELVRAATLGSTFCIPIWEETANHGRGDIRLTMWDPRQVTVDPSVTRAIDLQRYGEFMQVREVLALNAIRERYPERGGDVKGDAAWSQYTRRRGAQATYKFLITPMQRPWKREIAQTEDSATPRAELRHSWFRDWIRDSDGRPVWTTPRHIRYVVDAGGEVLKDEPMVYWHGELPGHIFDWGIELEHPHGISEVGGLRRIQYTLNRIIGQIMENVILTNRIKVIMDADAVDNKTADLMSANPNAMVLRKKQGRTLSYEPPLNAINPAIIPLVNLLLQAFDLASGMSEVTRGQVRGQTSGYAIEGLQLAAQSIVRLEARAFENWLERIFQHVIALIYQYFPASRVFAYSGPTEKLLTYEFERLQLIRDDAKTHMKASDAWRDFRFRVFPASSLAMSRIQRGLMAANLYQTGLIPGEDVLRAAEWPSPEETLAKARAEIQSGFGPYGGRNRLQRLPGTSKRSLAAV